MQTLKAVCDRCLKGFEKLPDAEMKRGADPVTCTMCGKERSSFVEIDYYKVYWERKRLDVLAQRKSRYETDGDYRQAVIDRAKKRYWEERSKKPIQQKQPPKSVLEVEWKHRPRVILENGKEINIWKTAELARRCKITTQTVKAWMKRGVIPGATMVDEKDRHWFSESYMDTLAGIVDLHWNSLKNLNDFAELVKAEFKKKV